MWWHRCSTALESSDTDGLLPKAENIDTDELLAKAIKMGCADDLQPNAI